MSEKRMFYDNPLESFRAGACLDLRVRIAIDMLRESPIFGGAYGWPQETAAKTAVTLALDIADEILTQADERGLIEPLDSPGAVERLNAHIKRQIAFQVEQAKETRRANEEAAKMVEAVRGALRPGH